MEVTLATALLVIAAWHIDRTRTAGDAAIAGTLLGAAVLTRFSYVPIALGGVWVIYRRAGVNRSPVAGALALASVAP